MSSEPVSPRVCSVGDPRVVRARSRITDALVVAHRGRPAEAERQLRHALGVLERRHRYAAAARAAATLGYLLRERGDASRAASTFEKARVLFDVASPPSPRAASARPKVDEERAEGEDYVHAKVLLTHARARPREPSSPGDATPFQAPSPLALIDAAADLTETLSNGHDALDRFCHRLHRLVDAEAVALCRPLPGRRMATSGVVPDQIPDRLLSAPAVGRLVSLRDDRTQWSATAVCVGRSVVAHLVVRRRCGASSDVPPGVEGVIRLAALLCASEVDWALQRSGWSSDDSQGGLLGRSVEMQSVRAAVSDAALCPYPVLITGETGTGKELVARGVHQASPRRHKPFCAVNCAALTDELFEAEVFGYARGAFTGAVAQRAGLFEEAHHGTLFLDEVGELSPRAQAKLLRVIQEREVRRLGENVTRRVDVRLVAATNRALSDAVVAGGFRQDLWFRLAVIHIEVPPLRDRREDILLLAKHFWLKAQTQMEGRAVLGPEVLEILAAHDWPGNVRELENTLAALAVRAPRRGRVLGGSLPPAVGALAPSCGPMTLARARERAERTCVREALARSLGRPGAAARALGISRQGLAKLMKRLGMNRLEISSV